MKMDKQALKKHHFWILLGVFTLLAVVLLVVIPVGVGGMIEGKEKAFEKQDKDLDANKSPKSKSYIVGLEANKEKLDVQREKIHRHMYVLQKDLVAFPGDLYDKYKNKEFGSAVDLSDMIAYRDDSVYMQQYRDMADIIKPTAYTPDWKTVLQPVDWSDRVAPSSEEVWLSVEDMCVRREVLRVLHDANEMLARFEPVDAGTTKLPFTRKFKSRLWELELTLDRKDRDYVFRGKLKNVSGRFQQIYEMDLYVWVQDKHSDTDWPKPVTLKVLQDKLSAGEELTLPETKAPAVSSPTGLFRVEQVLNGRTVPIKRLTNLTLGQNAGHRLADRKLAMAKFSQPKEGEKPADAGGNDSRGPGPGGKGSSMGPVNIGGAGGIGGYGGGSSDADRTPNGLTKARYVEVTDQVRRMPVALVVTVDQSDVPDLLVSLENTNRMRFQITQYHWQRMHGSLGAPSQGTGGSAPAMTGPASSGPRPSSGSGAGSNDIRGPGPGPGPGPGSSAGPRPGASGPAMGPATGPAGGMGGEPAALENEQSTVSLVDLTVYGVVNVYERPKDAAPQAQPVPSTTAAPAPATPAGPGAVPAPTPTPPSTTSPKTPAATSPTPPTTAPKNPAPTTPTAPATTAPKAGESKPPTTGKPATPTNPAPTPPATPTTPKTTDPK